MTSELLDPKQYHRRLALAVLNIGVDNASPQQIYEYMTLTKDPDRPIFQNLTLEQIKSHLQHFRKVYNNEVPHRHERKKGRSTNPSDSNGDTLNTEEQKFLDDYDSFVDFGLDAATARNDENHKNTVGGRAIGLVSRIVMMDDRVNSCKTPTSSENSGGNRSPAGRWDLHKKIPKLSPSEEASTLGRSINLVIGLLKPMNDFITTERRKQHQPQGYESDISSLGNITGETVAANQSDPLDLDFGVDIPKDNNHQSSSRPLLIPPQSGRGLTPLERIYCLPPLLEAGQPRLTLQLPLLPQQPLLHPNIANQLLNHHQHQHHYHHNQQQEPRENLQHYTGNTEQFQMQQQQQQQQRRERLFSYSDISSIEDNNVQAKVVNDVHANTDLFAQPKSQERIHINRSPELGKFIPVEDFERHNDDWQPNHSQQPRLSVEYTVAPLKPVVDVTLPPHSTSVLTATTALPRQNVSNASLQHPRRHIKKHQAAAAAAAAASSSSSPSSKQALAKRKRAFKDSTKEILFQKLQKAISKSSLNKEIYARCRRADRKWWGNDRTMEENHQEDSSSSSIVSSLSSSSSGDHSSEDFEHDDPRHPAPSLGRRMSNHRQHRQPHDRKILVSVTNTTSVSTTRACNTANHSVGDDVNPEEESWIFDRFPIPRNFRVECRSNSQLHPQQQQQQQLKQEQQQQCRPTCSNEFKNNEGEGSSWCSCCSSTDCSWGILG